MRPFALLCLTVLGTSGSIPQEPKRGDLRPGLVGEYFDIGEPVMDFPTIGARKPTVRRIDPRINFEHSDGEFAGTPLRDHFYVRWTGVIRIPKDGKYRFFTHSDDGSRLYVDGRLVVDNGGIHDMVESSGEVALKAGDHALKLDFFDFVKGAGCRIRWESDEISKQGIPAEALFHARDDILDKDK